MNPTIMTQSGRYFSFTEATPDGIHIEDIAHALSHLCRFTGHTREFYSVAQHSVMVSYSVPPEMALEGLLHDATEAYVGDVSRPLKMLLPEYQKIESFVWSLIAKRFGIAEDLPPEIKQVDNVLLFTERRDFMPANLKSQDEWAWGAPIGTLPFRIIAWPPEDAKKLFLDRFHFLTDL
jgi:hypothetical protein